MIRIFCLSVLFVSCFADDLGTIGKTYPIVEPDMIDWIKSKATVIMQNGKWQQIQNQAIAKVKQQINNPAPVLGITDAQVTNVIYLKPTIQVSNNITDTRGHIIIKAGNYNPLRYKSFDGELLFINGNNAKQVSWALIKNSINQRVKIVLTQGSFLDLDKKYKVWFYYDQNGKYTQKLNIKHVPAIVEQEGEKLKITEIANSEI